MIKLVYLSPTLDNGIPKNPGDTKFFNERNLDSIKELKGMLVPSNPISNKIAIVPEHQHIYQLALSYFNLDELPLSNVYNSNELLNPIELEENNSFITETQVVIKRIEPKIETQSLIEQDSNNNLLQPSKEVETVLSTSKEIKQDTQEEEETYSLSDEINIRKLELESTHHTKIKNLAEQYGLIYNNKELTIKAILQREFGDTAKSLEQEYLLSY